MNPPRSRIALQLAAMLALVLVLLIGVSTLFALRSLNEANLVTRESTWAARRGCWPTSSKPSTAACVRARSVWLDCSNSASAQGCRYAVKSV